MENKEPNTDRTNFNSAVTAQSSCPYWSRAQNFAITVQLNILAFWANFSKNISTRRHGRQTTRFKGLNLPLCKRVPNGYVHVYKYVTDRGVPVDK